MRKTLIGVVVGALVLAIAGIAAAGTKNGVTFATKYTTSKTSAPTGFKTRIKGAPRDASGRIEGAERVVVTFQRGTRFDTDVPGECDKARLQAEGRNGCPRNSIVGTGTAVAITGLASLDPVEETITAFNTDGGILFYLQGLTTLILEGELRGNRLIVDVPQIFAVPGYPKAVAVTEFNLDVKRIRRGRTAYVRTPRSCRRHFIVRATFEYPTVDDATNVISRTRCRKPPRRKRR